MRRLGLGTALLLILLGLAYWLFGAGEPPREEALDRASEEPASAPSRPAGLARGGHVTGTVQRDGQGVPRATVALRSGSQTLVALTLDDGAFRIDDVPAGEFYVSAQAADAASEVVGPLLLQPQGLVEGVVLVLGASVLVEGLVVDLVRHSPVAAALVVTPAGRFRTDAAGHFKLVGGRGQSWLEVSAAGYLTRTEWVSLEGAQADSHLELLLTPASHVSGLVLEGGQPIAGASVWLETVLGARRGERSPMALADAKGHFELDCADGLLRPEAATPRGARLHGRDLRLGIGERRDGLVIEGGEVTALEGVVTRDGAPLAGAGLSFVEAGTEQLVTGATSGPGGRFSVPALQRGKYLVQVALGHFSGLAGPFTHEGDGQSWRVEVHAGGTLAGRVQPAGPGIRVRWRSGDWSGPPAETVTDGQGLFSFEGVPAGMLSLDAEGPAGSGTARARLGDQVVITLAKGSVRVEVRDEKGAAVSEALLIARSLDTGAVRRQLVLAPDGRFRIELPPGAWELVAEVTGRGRSRAERLVVGGAEVVATLTLPPASPVRGSVRDSVTRLPIVGALVLAEDRSNANSFRTAVVSDARGEYQLPSVGRQGFLLVSKEGFQSTWKDVGAADSAGRIDFELVRGGAPNGLVADDTAQQFEGVGMVLAEDGARILVTSVTEGSPAERAGVLRGDVVVAVDGVPATPPVTAVIPRIRGPAGTPVRLTFDRMGQPLELVIRRRLLHF